ncbi:MAG TPA: class II aldolase/adducin family protein [Pseudonocardia sp.]
MTAQLSVESGRDGRPASMSEAEWDARVELAACYRIFNRLGWVELIFNHITARVPGADGHLLINPYGLTYREVTASNLVKIDLDGNIVGPSEWPVNAAGLVIHTAIHSARPDSHCVMHTHTTAGSAVACLRDGLDWNNFYAAQIYQQVAYHEFEGITVDPDEKPRLIADLGTRNLMILRNHGLLALGASVPAAFTALWTLQRACEIQLAAQQSGQPLRPVTEKAALQSSREALQFIGGVEAGRTVFNALWRALDRDEPDYRR